MRKVHTAVILKFWLCSGTDTPRRVGLSMQKNLTQIWVRNRLYMTCDALNNLLIQYSNIGCFSANIIRIQLLGGEGGACSLNGLEYKSV